MPKKAPKTFTTSGEKKDAVLKLKETLRLRKEEFSKLRSFLKEKEALHAKTVKETQKKIKESADAHAKALTDLAETQNGAILVDGRTKAAKANSAPTIAPPKKGGKQSATVTQ